MRVTSNGQGAIVREAQEQRVTFTFPLALRAEAAMTEILTNGVVRRVGGRAGAVSVPASRLLVVNADSSKPAPLSMRIEPERTTAVALEVLLSEADLANLETVTEIEVLLIVDGRPQRHQCQVLPGNGGGSRFAFDVEPLARLRGYFRGNLALVAALAFVSWLAPQYFEGSGSLLAGPAMAVPMFIVPTLTFLLGGMVLSREPWRVLQVLVHPDAALPAHAMRVYGSAGLFVVLSALLLVVLAGAAWMRPVRLPELDAPLTWYWEGQDGSTVAAKRPRVDRYSLDALGIGTLREPGSIQPLPKGRKLFRWAEGMVSGARWWSAERLKAGLEWEPIAVQVDPSARDLPDPACSGAEDLGVLSTLPAVLKVQCEGWQEAVLAALDKGETTFGELKMRFTQSDAGSTLQLQNPAFIQTKELLDMVETSVLRILISYTKFEELARYSDGSIGELVEKVNRIRAGRRIGLNQFEEALIQLLEKQWTSDQTQQVRVLIAMRTLLLASQSEWVSGADAGDYFEKFEAALRPRLRKQHRASETPAKGHEAENPRVFREYQWHALRVILADGMGQIDRDRAVNVLLSSMENFGAEVHLHLLGFLLEAGGVDQLPDVARGRFEETIVRHLLRSDRLKDFCREKLNQFERANVESAESKLLVKVIVQAKI